MLFYILINFYNKNIEFKYNNKPNNIQGTNIKTEYILCKLLNLTFFYKEMRQCNFFLNGVQ